MLCQSLLNSKETQLYTYRLFIFFPIMVYHRRLNVVPCVIQYGFVVYPHHCFKFCRHLLWREEKIGGRAQGWGNDEPGCPRLHLKSSSVTLVFFLQNKASK